MMELIAFVPLRKIGDFKSVSEWQEHCRKIDEAKARIIQQIETIVSREAEK